MMLTVAYRIPPTLRQPSYGQGGELEHRVWSSAFKVSGAFPLDHHEPRTAQWQVRARLATGELWRFAWHSP